MWKRIKNKVSLMYLASIQVKEFMYEKELKTKLAKRA